VIDVRDELVQGAIAVAQVIRNWRLARAEGACAIKKAEQTKITLHSRSLRGRAQCYIKNPFLENDGRGSAICAMALEGEDDQGGGEQGHGQK
jgi:hypothetical protein